MSVDIELSTEEIFEAGVVGLMRMTKALKRGNHTINGPDKNRLWHFHIEGSLGEMAVAKHFNHFWSSGDVNILDVGDIEVRTTPTSSLVIRDRDVELGKLDKAFVHVVGRFGKYTIVGWILGHDGIKAAGEQRDPTNSGRAPAWFVPRSALNDIGVSEYE
jgi:hypothetical protein